MLAALSGPIERAEVLFVDRLESTEFPYTSEGSDFLSVTRLSRNAGRHHAANGVDTDFTAAF